MVDRRRREVSYSDRTTNIDEYRRWDEGQIVHYCLIVIESTPPDLAIRPEQDERLSVEIDNTFYHFRRCQQLIEQPPVNGLAWTSRL